MKKEIVKEMKKKEKNETRAEERRESPKTQRMEKKYGIEKHKVSKPKKIKDGHHEKCPHDCKTKHRMK